MAHFRWQKRATCILVTDTQTCIRNIFLEIGSSLGSNLGMRCWRSNCFGFQVWQNLYKHQAKDVYNLRDYSTVQEPWEMEREEIHRNTQSWKSFNIEQLFLSSKYKWSLYSTSYSTWLRLVRFFKTAGSRFLILLYGGFHKWGYSQIGWFVVENPIYIDNLEAPIF